VHRFKIIMAVLIALAKPDLLVECIPTTLIFLILHVGKFCRPWRHAGSGLKPSIGATMGRSNHLDPFEFRR
jgi:hypothetical protein